MKRMVIAMLAVVMWTVFAGIVTADETENARAEYIRSHYAKYEYYIPMRDGVRLFTAVYVPNDTSKEYPILMLRSPYTVSPYGLDKYRAELGPTEEFEQDGFIFVYQDVRGKFMSEGEFVNMRPHNPDKKGTGDVDESTDTYDTIEWLIENIDGNNGRVGMWGISYPGFYTSAGSIDSHPALKAVSPQAPISDWFWDDMHHHGAFVFSMSFAFFSSFGVAREEPTTEGAERFEFPTPDAYRFFLDLGPLKNVNKKHFDGEIAFWNDLTKHPNYDDYWQSRNILPHLKNISAAVMVVGGWYDAEDLYGTFNTYQAIERQNPGINNCMVIGPWSHGGWKRMDGNILGDAHFGFNTSEYYTEHVIFDFFNHHLKDGDNPNLPEALVFETGANRWKRFDVWPPAGRTMKNLYFQAGDTMSFEPPKEKSAFDTYISDPDKPVPFSGDVNAFWPREYMAEDQRYASRRPDVQVYQTEVLEEDMTIAGPVDVGLFVSTTGSDSDFIVKLIDVQPPELPDTQKSRITPDKEAYQLMIRSEIFRGRFRESYEKPIPFKPGEVAEVSFPLQDVFHTFKRGHRIMIQVHSTWFPMIDRNPQKFVPNIFEADEDDYITVMNSIHRSKNHPSHITVGVME